MERRDFEGHKDRPAKTKKTSGICSLNDISAVVKTYTGQNSQNALKWLYSFTTYTDLKNIQGYDKIQLFKLLMSEQAADWILTLSPHLCDSEDHLFDAFLRRFGISESQKLTNESRLWHRHQLESESVDDYVSYMRLQGYQINMPESQLFKIICNGFKEPIKMFVMTNNCSSIEELLNIARSCEAASSSDRPNSQQLAITQLTEMVRELRKDITRESVRDTQQHHTMAPICDEEGQYHANLCACSMEQAQPNHSGTRAFSRNQNSQDSYSPRNADFDSNRPRYSTQQYRPRQQYAPRPDRQQTVRFQAPQYPAYTQRNTSAPQATKTGRCTQYCGRIHILDREHCRATNMICHYCSKVGHLQAVCKSNPLNQQRNFSQQ
jgi:hypothetical protein